MSSIAYRVIGLSCFSMMSSAQISAIYAHLAYLMIMSTSLTELMKLIHDVSFDLIWL